MDEKHIIVNFRIANTKIKEDTGEAIINETVGAEKTWNGWRSTVPGSDFFGTNEYKLDGLVGILSTEPWKNRLWTSWQVLVNRPIFHQNRPNLTRTFNVILQVWSLDPRGTQADWWILHW